MKQRIVLRCNLEPFSEADAQEYINSRLEKAGMSNQTVFPRELITEVHVRTQGIPRVINAVCDNLLLTAFALEARTCTVDMLDEVLPRHAAGVAGQPSRVARSRYSDENYEQAPFYGRGD